MTDKPQKIRSVVPTLHRRIDAIKELLNTIDKTWKWIKYSSEVDLMNAILCELNDAAKATETLIGDIINRRDYESFVDDIYEQIYVLDDDPIQGYKREIEGAEQIIERAKKALKNLEKETS